MSEQDRIAFEQFVVSDDYVEIRGRSANSDELAEGVYMYATAEANKRIELLENDLINLGKENADLSFKNDALEGEVAEMKEINMELQFQNNLFMTNDTELKASNHDLREALIGLGAHYHPALAATPAESLAKHDADLIEKVIAVIESLNVDAMFKPVSFSDMFVAIRALKGE